jgi:DNA-binding beta-propeller fold protein YncE
MIFYLNLTIPKIKLNKANYKTFLIAIILKFKNTMLFFKRKKLIINLVIVLLSFFKFSVYGQTLQEIMSSQVSLPNSWKLSPVGKMLPLGDLPLNIAVHPFGKLLAVTNNGQSIQSIQLIDASNMKTLDMDTIRKSWLGLAFSKDGKYLYASGGNDNWIIRYQVKNNQLSAFDTLVIGKPWPEKISIAGIAVDDKQEFLYTVTKENNSLYVYDIKQKKVQKQIPLGGEGFTCLLSDDGNMLYITCWGCDKVILYDTRRRELDGWIPVGDNPNDMCLTNNGKFLFVSNANDNSVSVISLEQKRVIEVLNSALYPDSPSGSTANSLALSKDEKTLYIANADNNCLAVFDVSNPGKSFSKGFIPTGWYPTCVRVVDNTIFVANGKGLSSKPNPLGPSPESEKDRMDRHKGLADKNPKVQYIGGLFSGTLQAVETPDTKQLGIYSEAVYKNVPYNKDNEMISAGEEGNPVPMKVGESSPIKYVFYVIKENRTYDQVLGDLPQGNGDKNLVLFGRDVTPNQHAIAEQFVLLDNFYVDGEVSADGHNWTMGAYATDYLEKNWPTSYGSRGGTYPGEAQREIANSKVFLWDYCKKYGVSYRSYGEFISDYNKPNLPVLEDHFCEKYIGYNLRFRDTTRFYIWKQDFDSLLAIGKVPQFNSIRFGNDHTEGLRVGRPTPKAHVADNDLAVGMFVEYLSHTPIWD